MSANTLFPQAIAMLRHWLGYHDISRDGHEPTIVLEFKTEHDARVAADMLRMDFNRMMMDTQAPGVTKVCGLEVKFRWTESRAIPGRWGGNIVEHGGEV